MRLYYSKVSTIYIYSVVVYVVIAVVLTQITAMTTYTFLMYSVRCVRTTGLQ